MTLKSTLQRNENELRRHIDKLRRFSAIIKEGKSNINYQDKYKLTIPNMLQHEVKLPLMHIVLRMYAMFRLGIEEGIKCAGYSDSLEDTVIKSLLSLVEDCSNQKQEEETQQDSSPETSTELSMTNDQSPPKNSSEEPKSKVVLENLSLVE